MKILLVWLINAAALFALPYIFESIRVETFYTALIVALILSIINTIIRPVLLILTLPVTILTLGLFVIVLNALLFALSFAVLQGILNVHFDLTFLQILVGYLIYVVVSFVLTRLIR